jgi:hypothetical protein
MKSVKSIQFGWRAGWLALALAFVSVPTTTRANVYATDIKLNSALTGTVHPVGGSVTLTYHLNDNATAGVTINILSGSIVVSSTSIAYPSAAGAGTSLGLNTVTLTAPVTSGTYSVGIIAGATGYANWQQISPLDTNHTACYERGLAVDKNTSSPYYGRVVFGCGNSTVVVSNAATAYATTRSNISQLVGLYKFNADGTPADEGVFGYAGYTTDDAGYTTASQPGGPNQMANGYTVNVGNAASNPFSIVIGDDDTIYWSDSSNNGSVQNCDMQATSYHTVFNTASFANCSDKSRVNHNGNGWREFDVINTGVASTYDAGSGNYSGNAALFINDQGDSPAAGVWMWHLVGSPGNMMADPTDTYGQQCIYAGAAAAVVVRTDGIAVDNNLDCFTCQDRANTGDVNNRNYCFANWNGGVLPPGDQGGISGAGGGGFVYSQITAQWAVGSADNTDTGTFAGTFIDSRAHPTLVAFPMQAGLTNNGGIRLLNALNTAFVITNIALTGGGTTLTLTCACSPYYPNVTAGQLSLESSTVVQGPYNTPVSATFTALGNNVFQTTIPIPGTATFYMLPVLATGGGTIASGTVNSIDGTTSRGSHGNVTGTLASIDVGQFYFGCCFDNVGNLYGANATDNYWKVWSPPGPNTATTVAVVTLSTP